MKYMFFFSFLPWFPVNFPIIQFCEWMINEPNPPCLSVDGFKADGAYRLEKALSGHRRWGRSRFTKRPMEPDNFTEAVRRPCVLCVFFPFPINPFEECLLVLCGMVLSALFLIVFPVLDVACMVVVRTFFFYLSHYVWSRSCVRVPKLYIKI